MATEKAPGAVLAHACLLIAIQNGRVIVSMNLPLRWTLVIISLVAAATGYTSIAQFVAKLLVG